MARTPDQQCNVAQAHAVNACNAEEPGEAAFCANAINVAKEACKNQNISWLGTSKAKAPSIGLAINQPINLELFFLCIYFIYLNLNNYIQL